MSLNENELLDYFFGGYRGDPDRVQCRCGWSLSLRRSPYPVRIARDHIRNAHRRDWDAPAEWEEEKYTANVLRNRFEALNAALTMGSPPANWWNKDSYLAELAKSRFTEDQPAPKEVPVTSAEAPHAIAEAIAILTLNMPLMWHLKNGCHCQKCMDVFLTSYDGFEAVFEQEEEEAEICHVEQSADGSHTRLQSSPPRRRSRKNPPPRG